MIYTVTLSPSIDYVVRMSSGMRFNVTNRTDSEEFYFGGKGLNVSQVLAELDLDSTALGFIAGFTGDAIEKGIRNSRIRTDFIRPAAKRRSTVRVPISPNPLSKRS